MNLILICALGLAEAAATVGIFWLVMRVIGGPLRSLSDRADEPVSIPRP
jgi:hypothetical protein